MPVFVFFKSDQARHAQKCKPKWKLNSMYSGSKVIFPFSKMGQKGSNIYQHFWWVGPFQVWDILVLYSQFIVFLFIDLLRNASSTLPRLILVCAAAGYIRTAFANFEDDYRNLKEVVINICREYSAEAKGESTKQPHVYRLIVLVWLQNVFLVMHLYSYNSKSSINLIKYNNEDHHSICPYKEWRELKPGTQSDWIF